MKHNYAGKSVELGEKPETTGFVYMVGKKQGCCQKWRIQNNSVGKDQGVRLWLHHAPHALVKFGAAKYP